MAEQIEVRYSLKEVVDEWIAHSLDGYGPQYTDPKDHIAVLHNDAPRPVDWIGLEEFTLVRWRDSE